MLQHKHGIISHFGVNIGLGTTFRYANSLGLDFMRGPLTWHICISWEIRSWNYTYDMVLKVRMHMSMRGCISWELSISIGLSLWLFNFKVRLSTCGVLLLNVELILTSTFLKLVWCPVFKEIRAKDFEKTQQRWVHDLWKRLYVCRFLWGQVTCLI